MSKHYVINEWDKKQAAKRGGDVEVMSIDTEQGNDLFNRSAPPRQHLTKRMISNALEPC